MLNLKVIIASTRPGRKGSAIASWIYELTKERKEFNVELLDLAVINLPFLDEPKHPRFKDYSHEHTKNWSKVIDEGDAYIIVTAEYNYGYPAPLKNALDFLFQEWTYKPVAFVSYGGIAGGTRAVQQLKQIVTALKMMPVTEAVNIPFFTKHIDEQGKFNADEILVKSAEGMLDELAKWGDALTTLRNKTN
ncbi:MAG: NAD(P)H-dependent oxidoreductase [Ginsengibacter sp.]